MLTFTSYLPAVPEAIAFQGTDAARLGDIWQAFLNRCLARA